MTRLLEEATKKENEKFDLIFSILVGLQKRQAQLEDSVQSAKAQLSTAAAEQEAGRAASGAGQGMLGGNPDARLPMQPHGSTLVREPAWFTDYQWVELQEGSYEVPYHPPHRDPEEGERSSNFRDHPGSFGKRDSAYTDDGSG